MIPSNILSEFFFTFERVCKVSRRFTGPNLREINFTISMEVWVICIHYCAYECFLKFHKCLWILFSSKNLILNLRMVGPK